ncbi:MAG: T9SS type A sorting domain-containing protein [Prevotellaceae bacterium]|nr:T9SS type A sorting domain-containing protein [Prevotellaceae bacterium]
MKSEKSEMFRIALFLMLLLPAALPAQKTGAWRDHFACTQGVDVLAQGDRVICATSAGLIFFDGEVEKISKVNGLSDFGLTAALYDAPSGCIFVGYDNGNIDVLRSADPHKIRQGALTKSIGAWKNFATHGRKSINRFLRVDDLIFVATGSQMLELKGDEIRANYSVDSDTLAVQDVALLGNTIAAATSKGLYVADKNSTARYNFGSWQRKLPNANVISLAVANGQLYALQADGTLQATSDLQNFSQPRIFSNPRALSAADGELWVSTAAGLYNLGNPQKNISTYNLPSFSPRRVAAYGSGICVADAELGLVVSAGASFAQALPNGPMKNETVALSEYGGKVVAAANGALSVLESKGAWTGSTSSQISAAQAVKVNPKNTAEAFVATSNGVATFGGGNFLGKDLLGDVRGMAFDPDGNLFAFASNSAAPVQRRNADGSWSELASSALQPQALGSAALANNVFWGIAWGIAEPNRLFLYSPGANPNDAADDKASVFDMQVSVDEKFSENNSIYALAADLNGEIWLGTGKGVVVYSSVGDPFAGVPQGQRIKIPTEIPGQAAYLLQYERVTAVAVDGGNRKWLGTRDAGVFLQSDDGVEQLRAFNAQNSPLPSNYIKDIAVNSQTGEVIFATDKGMVGFYSDATAGRVNFDEVKVYPNPVRPDMSLVTISNLVEDASVKITDVSGNLVFFATANGGTATWDVQNLNGRRVATGVYLIFLADRTGQESKVVKLLVIN